MTIEQMRAKLSSGDVDVEDILEIAKGRALVDVPELLSLADEAGWRTDGSGLADWVDAVVVLLRCGPSGLARAVADGTVKLAHGLGTLEEVLDPLSVTAATEIGAAALQGGELASAVRAAQSLNLLLCFEPRTSATPDVAANARSFLHKLLSAEHVSEEQICTVYCALRAVGDRETISLIKQMPPLSGAWAGTDRLTTKAIRARLGSSN